MQRNNQFGLARSISEPVKRAVRQACGFGCVVCGNPFIQYHHADVAFADARDHEASKITLLCGGCHDRVTRGTYSDEMIAEHIQRPYCLTHGPAFADLDYGREAPRIRFAGSEFDSVTMPVRVADYAMLMLERPPEQGAPVLISAFFTNSNGEISLVIRRNHVQLLPRNWDVTTEGTYIRIWDAFRRPSLVLNVVPRRYIEVERIEAALLGWGISGDANELRVTKPGQSRPNTFRRFHVSGMRVGFQFGEPTLR